MTVPETMAHVPISWLQSDGPINFKNSDYVKVSFDASFVALLIAAPLLINMLGIQAVASSRE